MAKDAGEVTTVGKIEVERRERRDGMRPRFDVTLSSAERAVIFVSTTLQVTCESEAAAMALGGAVREGYDRGHLQPSGLGGKGRPGALECVPELQLNWTGDLDDDCTAVLDDKGLIARAEWMNGPKVGGVWWCAVRHVAEPDGETVRFNPEEVAGLRVRSGKAARWLCELGVALESPA